MRILALGLVLVFSPRAPAQWQPQASNTEANLRGLSVVSDTVAWASGTRGTFLRTTDGGKTWAVGSVAGAETLDFRDVEAFGEATAYLLSAGPGSDSRIYKTTDGGKNWALQFQNAEAEAFYDAIAFWDEQRGLAFGDPVRGRFRLLTTDDGGAHWRPLAEKELPEALPGEGAFAASGTCLVTRGASDAWFVTGGAKAARVFHSGDRGRTWTAAEAPIAAGVESAGIFSIAFRDAAHGMIAGGDYRRPQEAGANAAVTGDGGKTWKATAGTLPYCSAATWAKDRWVAVGTAGAFATTDGGATWQRLSGDSFNAAAFAPSGAGWAVGPRGRIARWGS